MKRFKYYKKQNINTQKSNGKKMVFEYFFNTKIFSAKNDF